jgi:hypothetical protein
MLPGAFTYVPPTAPGSFCTDWPFWIQGFTALSTLRAILPRRDPVVYGTWDTSLAKERAASMDRVSEKFKSEPQLITKDYDTWDRAWTLDVWEWQSNEGEFVDFSARGFQFWVGVSS